MIKFRGKSNVDGSWIISTSLINDENGAFLLTDTLCIEIDSDTIGQFTGLYDSNENEIYQGDIVEWKGRKYEVIFKSGMFYASVETFNKNVYGGIPLWALTYETKCLIVGNIHDQSTNK